MAFYGFGVAYELLEYNDAISELDTFCRVYVYPKTIHYFVINCNVISTIRDFLGGQNGILRI